MSTGAKIFKSFTALIHALMKDNVDVTSYLLYKHTHPLSMEYTIKSDQSESVYTLLTDFMFLQRPKFRAKITQLLLDHGADPAK